MDGERSRRSFFSPSVQQAPGQPQELAAEEILLPGERLLEHAERGFGPPAAAPGVSG